MSRKKIQIKRQLLQHLYWRKNLSTYAIARKFCCSPATIENRLEEFHIPKKSSSQARMKYSKKDFSGSVTEKAYMVGFRIGDLNVYKTSPTAETIIVRCHTTQKDQVKILQQTFGSFGHVHVSDNTAGHYHVNCFLNSSFSFLLPKTAELWSWISGPHTWAAFIAGYIDAEGNFIINQGKARFKIDSYDKEVFDYIVRWLLYSGILFRFRKIASKGDIRCIAGRPTKFSKNLWRLNVNEKASLLKLIRTIMPFIRHRKRLQDMRVSEKNILLRTIHE